MGEKIALTDKDWGLLLPTEVHMLGQTKLYLRPVNIDEVANVLELIDDSKDFFTKHNITAETYHQPLQLIAITKLVVNALPVIISDCTDLREEDIKRLPLEPAVELVTALIEINEKSKDGLIKNLTALAEKITNLISVGESETLPVSSLKKGTAGKK